MRRAAITRQAQDGVRTRRSLRPRLYAQKSALVAQIPQAHNPTPRPQTRNVINHISRVARLESTHEGALVAGNKHV